MKFAVGGTPIRDTGTGVPGKQKLHRCLTRSDHPGCVGTHDHTLRNGGVTRPHQTRRTFYFYDADTTASHRGDFFVVAQAGYINTGLPGRFQDRYSRAAEHFLSVNFQSYFTQLFDPLDLVS